MKTSRVSCTLILISTWAAPALAQIVPGPDAIVYVVNGSATTASGSSGTPLANLGATDVVNFLPVFTFSAEKILTNVSVNTILGDNDNDGVFFENFIGGYDAIEVPKVPEPPIEIRNMFSFVYSSTDSFGGVADGSLFRYRPGAAGGDFVQIVLSEDQILSAIGQSGGGGGGDLDTDAFTQDTDGNIYLSFSDDELVKGTLMGDGGIVMLPASALTYDASGIVTAVTPSSAVILLNEADVDAMVLNSGLTTSTTVGDLSCLAVDNNAQSFIGLDGQPHPNLYFSGESLGPVTLTTKNGGEFATTGSGSPIGAAVPSLGQYGLGSMAGGLSALTVLPETGRALATDVVDGEVNFPGENLVEFDIGNCTPLSTITIFFTFIPDSVGNQALGKPVSGFWFPQFYPLPTYANATVPTDFGGIARVGGALGHPLSGMILVAQPFDPGSVIFGTIPQLGAPSQIHFP